jgi:hypothetical protein
MKFNEVNNNKKISMLMFCLNKTETTWTTCCTLISCCSNSTGDSIFERKDKTTQIKQTKQQQIKSKTNLEGLFERDGLFERAGLFDLDRFTSVEVVLAAELKKISE